MKRPNFKSVLSLAIAGTLCGGGVLAQAPTGAQDGGKTRHERRVDERRSKRAQQKYDRLGYAASAPLYEADGSLSMDEMVRLATAYRLNHDTENAELWYGQVLAAGSEEPEHLLYFAQALQSNGRHAEARAYFGRFDAATADDARGAAFAKTMDAGVGEDAVEIRNERAINGRYLDFSPSFRGDDVVFVSTRPVRRPGAETKDDWIDEPFMSLFEASPTGDERSLLGAPREFAPELNTQFHEGPLTFDANGERMFFTRNAYDEGGRHDSDKGIMRLNIYTSTYDDGAWSAPVGLPWNTDDYEEAHPTLSADGRTLYFASNRPGGHGGMDLYRSQFVAGRWQGPENLGPRVNTAGNEAFPFLHQGGELYFASDGLGGLGGMDIFRLAGADTSQSPVNVGKPYNSRKDDFGYVLSEDGTRGYLTSARKGGEGRDDIYSFVRPRAAVVPVLQPLCVHVAGAPGDRLADAEVEVRALGAGADGAAYGTASEELFLKLRETGEAGEYRLAILTPGVAPMDPADRTDGDAGARALRTGGDGAVTATMTPGRRYRVTVRREGYDEEVFEMVAPATTAEATERCTPLRATVAEDDYPAGPSITLSGVTKNERYGNVLPGVELRLLDLCTGAERTTVSGADGGYSFGCVPCGCEFVITGEKAHFAAAESTAGTLGEACLAKPCAEGGVVEVPMGLTPAALVAQAAPMQPRVLRAPEGLGGGVLRDGAVIELKNIYYDFDESYIREDARDDLDHLVAMMREFPGMIVELGSHTDARAPEKYNATLSQARAEAAREYVLRRGIDGRRVSARGFGESRLVNKCRDFVECTEYEHQVNRRTEVRIVTVGDAGVSVRYVEGGPERVDAAEAGRVFVWE